MTMYDPGDAPLKLDVGMHEELAMFLKRTQERLEREVAEADQAEAHAKMARHRAEQTRRVYEATAKLHESMTSQPDKEHEPESSVSWNYRATASR